MLLGYLPPLGQPRLSLQRHLSEGTLQEPLIRFVGKVPLPGSGIDLMHSALLYDL